jgi:DNA-nicking Smr family endonuclease
MTRRDVRRIKIDARFDMHGFSLEKGFEALARFLHRAQEKRFKTVLVVTGKGSLSAENTLRRNLPKWAEESPLRDLISALHHPAKIQDGGNGAFYIDVRSRNKTRVKK